MKKIGMTATAQQKTAAGPIPGHTLLLALLLCACLSGCGSCKKGSSGIDNIVWFPLEHRLAQDSPWRRTPPGAGLPLADVSA